MALGDIKSVLSVHPRVVMFESRCEPHDINFNAKLVKSGLKVMNMRLISINGLWEWVAPTLEKESARYKKEALAKRAFIREQIWNASQVAYPIEVQV